MSDERVVRIKKRRTPIPDKLDIEPEPEGTSGASPLPDMTALEYASRNGLEDEAHVRIAYRLMHRDCAVIEIGNSLRVMVVEPGHSTKIIGPHKLRWKTSTIRLLKKRDFLDRYEGAGYLAETGDGRSRRVTVAERWIKSRHRKHYKALVFEPGEKAQEGTFNLWLGWGVTPQPGDWSILREHILDNICGGDENLHAWVLDWCADMVQRSRRKPGTALVLKGEKGTGKTKMVEWLEYIIGAGITLDKAEHLTGQFNAHLANKLLVTADEAVWGGSKQSVGALNTLITSAVLPVVRKGVDLDEMPSRHRVIIVGNNDWLVPATADERRYAVFEVGTGRQQDHAFFAALDDQMANGGAEAMLYDILHRKITADVTTAPRTEGLGHQIAQGLPTIDRLLVRLATEGLLRDHRGETVAEVHEDREARFEKSRFMDHVERVHGRPPSPREVGSALKGVGAVDFRPKGQTRQIILPCAPVFRTRLEARLRTPLHVLAYEFGEAGDYA